MRTTLIIPTILPAVLATALGLSLSVNALAAGGEHPCKTIKTACEAAGYVKGDHKKDHKGLFVDCLKPIMEGKPVAGVTVSPKDVADCQAKRAAHKK